MIKSFYFLFAVCFFSAGLALGQGTNGTPNAADAYTQVITKRADKIVSVIGITDSVAYKNVLTVVVDQYRNINNIHNDHDSKVKALKLDTSKGKPAIEAAIKLADAATTAELSKQHDSYIASLAKYLQADQIEKIKDGMTYNILSLTYNAYLDEIPNLTDAQKVQIKAWLTEARELAIDAESSEKKHAVFGKYKGRINNYLSAQGYDMKKEAADWQERIKAKQAGK